MASRTAIERMADTKNAVTDVFLIVHGWQGDVNAAIEQYDRWVRAMVAMAIDRERAENRRPGFSPLIVGLHWPSLPWGDEEIPGDIGRTISDVLLAPLRQLSFWKMKDRARRFGETGARRLLADLQSATQVVTRFHLMGHSFGCIVACGAVTGVNGITATDALARPVDSLFLVQGALSLWAFAADIPYEPGAAGYFHGIIRDHRVSGPIVTTRSSHDRAIGVFYPGAAAIKQQVELRQTRLPKYGGAGSFGLQGLPEMTEDLSVRPATASYAFEPGRIYNIDASEIIRAGGGAAGAHTDIAHPEIAHIFWEAAVPRESGRWRD